MPKTIFANLLVGVASFATTVLAILAHHAGAGGAALI